MKRRLHISICPAEHIPGAVPATRAVLEELLRRNSDDSAALFARGNTFLREMALAEAIRDYSRALQLRPELPELRCNLGIAYRLAGQLEEAARELRQAVLRRPELLLAQTQLVEILLAQGDLEGAGIVLERAARVIPGDPALHALSGMLYERKGDTQKAKECFELSLAGDPAQPGIANILGEMEFSAGKALFLSGNRGGAFAVWGAAYRKYQRAFSAHQPIARELADLIKQSARSDMVEQKLRALKGEEAQAPAPESGFFYDLFCEFYFSTGVLFELYLPFEAAAEQEQRLREALRADGVYPFINYRLAGVLSFLGRLEECLNEFEFCADHLPRSKKRGLKLERIIEFVKQVLALQGVDVSGESSAAEDEWDYYGFSDPFQQQAWKKAGAEPAEAAAWKSAGFTPQQCKSWRPLHIDPEQARQWTAAGFAEPKEAARLIKAGFSPELAKCWLEKLETAEQAVQWKKAGFSDPGEVLSWKRYFTFAWEAARWKQLKFTAEEAQRLLERGINDPFIARASDAEEDT